MVSEKYVVIAAHRAAFEVTKMCRVLPVARAGFYAAKQRAPSHDARVDAQLLGLAHGGFVKAKGRYGSPRIQRVLKQQGVAIAEKRVARLTREAQLVARPRRRVVVTTRSTPD